MSLPNHTSPPLSSSSSKQSIRGTLGSTAPSRPRHIERPPTAQHIDNGIPAEQQSHEAAETTGSIHYEEETNHRDNSPSSSQQQFQPFFTLIEDAASSEYYHPTVHYIFSDDDADIVTEAALRSLETGQDSFPYSAKGSSRPTRDQQQEGEGEEDTYGQDGELSGSRKESLLPPPIPGVRDNFIILDVEPTSLDGQGNGEADPGLTAAAAGTKSISTSPATQTLPQPQQQRQSQPQQPPPQFTVTSSNSLTPAWQVMGTQLVPAPTFENSASGEQPSNGGLMLKIHGTAGLPPNIASKDKDKEKGSQRLEDMMDQFAKRMSELRQIIDVGEEGQSTEEERPDEPPSEQPQGIENNGELGELPGVVQDEVEGGGQNGSPGEDEASHFSDTAA
ncbi:hypothetical protein ASPWEDRAFT_29623 [Aspergillus wentii DTO 134E9]|uniref:Uncharacterized protein n=1 Tax=Aspergillus wentii DTO 134E9 TaxID=1073089 RepID=A0A1L9RHS7_ASPWE|nr:uncharacterized protein ASPWEDRAFT_29623 [Aspergillus wentii DTO 134E9]OJJ34482.1 hypothetical protein ASPWEDRAFT_29623 [Aspergillus wentii DTO 134E9]